MAEGPVPSHTRPLQALSHQDAERFGGKSASLGELLAAGIPVPPGFALSASGFDAFVTAAGLAPWLAELTGRLPAADLQAVTSASEAIRAALASAPLPDAVAREIADGYRALAGVAGEPEPPVAVRSSAVGEDSHEATFAGQQETQLWVRGVQAVREAVHDCWVSLYSPPALTYRARLADAPRPAMGITVQLMVDAAVSGVMFTCNPTSGDPSMVAINASWGLGLAVVGGEVTPDDHLVSKVTGEVVREHVHDKHLQYVPDPNGTGAVAVDVPDALRSARCLDAAALQALLDVARRVERHFGDHQDIEWAIARRAALPESLFVVQSRPVTAIARAQAPAPADAMSLVMSTFGVKRGTE